MKIYLNIFFALIICVGCFSKANAQAVKTDSCGVYNTNQDYIEHHFAYAIPVHRNAFTIWPQGFFVNKDIELKTPDTTIVYQRNDVWGYTDHRGRVIRMFNGNHYRIMCENGLIIYLIYSPTKTSYHFSKTLNASIYRLTRKNIVKEFADNPEFIKKIKSIRKKHLLTWLEKENAYLINTLLKQ